MNKKLYEYWIRRALIASKREERRKEPLNTPEEIRRKLLEQMCSIAMGNVDLDTEVRLRYITPNGGWHAFHSGIFEMREFLEIINRNLPEIMKDKTQKSLNYIKGLAVGFMKEYYDLYGACVRD